MPVLRKLILTNAEADSIYRKFQALALLPEKEIIGAFHILKKEAQELNKAAFDPFLRYFFKQWIQKVMISILFIIMFAYYIIFLRFEFFIN